MSGYHHGGGGRGGRGGRSHGRGRSRPRGAGGNTPSGPKPLIGLCRYFAKNGACHDNRCNFSHDIKAVTSIENSDRLPQQSKHKYNNQEYHPSSDVTLWNDSASTPPALKIFTSSHDGCWRLYNTSTGTPTPEIKHRMGDGPIDILTVESDCLFCGFEGASAKVPGSNVGMIFCWNLRAPGDAPMELTMHPDLSPYAHNGRVSSFLTGMGEFCVSGGRDGVIRIWKFTINGGKGGFSLVKECCGHVGEVTGLVIVGGMLWSCSTDATIRLWDAGGGGAGGSGGSGTSVGMGSWECKYLITKDTPPSGNPPQSSATSGVGHNLAITALLPFESPAGSFVLSSSLDGAVKVWNSTNGECMSSTNHGMGVVCMAISSDIKSNPILLCGTESGKIMVRMILQTAKTKEPMRLLCSLDASYINVGHYGPVKRIKPGPGNTFYSVGTDGQLIVWQILGDLGS